MNEIKNLKRRFKTETQTCKLQHNVTNIEQEKDKYGQLKQDASLLTSLSTLTNGNICEQKWQKKYKHDTHK